MYDDGGYFEDKAHARRGDPAESHWAADSVNVAVNRAYVITVFKRVGKPMTHQFLVEVYHALAASGIVGPQEDSGIRTRCNELTKKEHRCLIRKSTKMGKTKSGRDAAMWELNS